MKLNNKRIVSDIIEGKTLLGTAGMTLIECVGFANQLHQLYNLEFTGYWKYKPKYIGVMNEMVYGYEESDGISNYEVCTSSDIIHYPASLEEIESVEITFKPKTGDHIYGTDDKGKNWHPGTFLFEYEGYFYCTDHDLVKQIFETTDNIARYTEIKSFNIEKVDEFIDSLNDSAIEYLKSKLC